MTRLSAATLAASVGLDAPDYDRGSAPTTVHLGVGAFARAHMAVYADDLLRCGRPAMLRGISLRSAAAEQQLGPQDSLFSVTTREPGTPPSTRVIGSIASIATGVQPALNAIADPATALVTLTVTEKGYELGGRDSVPAVLARALDQRRRITDVPIVMASLDNLLDNGRVLQQQVQLAATGIASDLGEWIGERVRFPRSVVDRMVPATTDADRLDVARRLGLADEAAIVAEAHRSWVLEAVDVPFPLEEVGVEIVDDIAAYQQRKLWLLNGPHSAIAYAGLLAGHRTIAEAAVDPVVARFVRALVQDVIAVAPLPGLDSGAFAEEALQRFTNPSLGHACAQVGADGSRKLPQRVLPVMELRRSQGRSTDRFDLVVAAWLAAVTSTPLRGRSLPAVEDPEAEAIREAMSCGGPSTAIAITLGDEHADGIVDAFDRLAREGVHALEEVA